MKIAFLGLGRMGSAMASRLAQDGTLSLVVSDILISPRV